MYNRFVTFSFFSNTFFRLVKLFSVFVLFLCFYLVIFCRERGATEHNCVQVFIYAFDLLIKQLNLSVY